MRRLSKQSKCHCHTFTTNTYSHGDQQRSKLHIILLCLARLLITLPLHRLRFLFLITERRCHLAGLFLQAIRLRYFHTTPAPRCALSPLNEFPMVVWLVCGLGRRFRVFVMVSDILSSVEHNLNPNCKLVDVHTPLLLIEREED